MSELLKFDISCEEWREYDLAGGRIYRIEEPQFLYLKADGTHHRVVDGEGVAHCLPAHLPTPENMSPVQ